MWKRYRNALILLLFAATLAGAPPVLAEDGETLNWWQVAIEWLTGGTTADNDDDELGPVLQPGG